MRLKNKRLREADKLIGKLNVIAAYEFDEDHYEKIADELLKLYDLFGFEIQPSVIARSKVETDSLENLDVNCDGYIGGKE